MLLHFVVFTLNHCAEGRAAQACLEDARGRATYEVINLDAHPDVVEELQYRLQRAGRPCSMTGIRMPQIFCEDRARSEYVAGLRQQLE